MKAVCITQKNKNPIVQFSNAKFCVIGYILSSKSLREDVNITLFLLCSKERLSSLKKIKSASVFFLYFLVFDYVALKLAVLATNKGAKQHFFI